MLQVLTIWSRFQIFFWKKSKITFLFRNSHQHMRYRTFIHFDMQNKSKTSLEILDTYPRTNNKKSRCMLYYLQNGQWLLIRKEKKIDYPIEHLCLLLPSLASFFVKPLMHYCYENKLKTAMNDVKFGTDFDAIYWPLLICKGEIVESFSRESLSRMQRYTQNDCAKISLISAIW